MMYFFIRHPSREKSIVTFGFIVPKTAARCNDRFAAPLDLHACAGYNEKCACKKMGLWRVE
ncbi:MAG: hypothetical protein IJ354_09495 [Clostridia bacterium]|nr:hypothetical protein [Clostridia bacterium]